MWHFKGQFQEFYWCAFVFMYQVINFPVYSFIALNCLKIFYSSKDHSSKCECLKFVIFCIFLIPFFFILILLPLNVMININYLFLMLFSNGKVHQTPQSCYNYVSSLFIWSTSCLCIQIWFICYVLFDIIHVFTNMLHQCSRNRVLADVSFFWLER